MRVKVTLRCSECKQRNYNSMCISSATAVMRSLICIRSPCPGIIRNNAAAAASKAAP